MKLRTKKILTFVLCLTVAMCMALPSLAYRPADYHACDYEKYTAFFELTDEELGLDNSKAINESIQEINDSGLFFLYIIEEDNIISPVIHCARKDGLKYVKTVDFYALGVAGHEFWGDDGYYYSGEVIVELHPDFGGSFDISGTLTEQINSPLPGATHITSVIVDNCENLKELTFNDQQYCTRFSAVNCPSLKEVNVTGCKLERITVQPAEYTQVLDVIAIGNGNIGINYNSATMRLYAKTDADNFLGWYVDGECVGTNKIFAYSGTGTVYACFAGDANGDGIINVLDANLIMRKALSGFSPSDISICDLDNNGDISTSDAVLAIRIGMGL